MNTIVVIILENLLKQVLSILGGITKEDWERVKEWVREAATKLANEPGLDRREYVVKKVQEAWSKLSPFLVNLLVDGAFGYLRKKGEA